MAQQTALSVTGTPGRVHNFVAKTAAGGVKGVGPFTELSALATPGGIHSFVAKTPVAPAPKGLGPFTELSVMATPGGIHSFLAKTLAADVSGTRRQRQMKSLIKSRRRRKC